MSEYANRHARKPKPESKVTNMTSYWLAYDADGLFKGEVKLTTNSKARYEKRGYTFKRKSR